LRTVELVVNPDGSVKVTYQGYKGDQCFEEAKRIYEQLRALGVEVKVEKTIPTSEAYISEKVKVSERV